MPFRRPRQGALPARETGLESRSPLCYHYGWSVIMLRTQIQITTKQSSLLKALAARRGVSMAELIRQGVDLVLSQGSERTPDEISRRALQAVGMFRSGTHDVSVRHDVYLSEEYDT
jgi:hypothetical protein